MLEQTEKTKKRMGRPFLLDTMERVPGYAIKLPENQVLWLSRGKVKRARSERLREIMQAAVDNPQIVLPSDPGPGVSARHSYTIPDQLIQQLLDVTGEKLITRAIRRAIRADMADLLPGTN